LRLNLSGSSLSLGLISRTSSFGPGWRQPRLWVFQSVKRLISGSSTSPLRTSREEAIKLLGIFKEEFAPVLDNYQESEYIFVHPTTPLIESIVLDIPVGPNYKYLNNTIKDSSYFPTTECGLVIKKKYLKVYLEECLVEYVALEGLNELIQRAPLIEAGQKLSDPFYCDLWGNLDHLRESYSEYLAEESFGPDSEEESVASLDTQA